MEKSRQEKLKFRLSDYLRGELRHAGPNDVNREAELERPSRVACSDLLDGMVI